MRDKLVGELVESQRHLFQLMAIAIGDSLGLYAALTRTPNQTSTELAKATSSNERYIREWLEHQTVTGILVVDDVKADAKARRFSLPKGHAEVLTDKESLAYLTPVLRLALSTAPMLPKLVDAYKTGKGVPWSAYGREATEGQGGANRATFLQLIGSEWLPKIKDVDARLKADPPARVADFGCGVGWSSIAMALAYPKIKVDGYDIDAMAVELATANAKAAGVGDRVSFHVKSAYDPEFKGSYDLATAFEVVHDLSRPVDALKTMRRLVGDTGSVVIVDERVGHEFTGANADWVERLWYGWSITMCLPTGKDDTVSAETGSIMRPKILEGYASQGGFTKFEVLPIENDLFRFYHLRA